MRCPRLLIVLLFALLTQQIAAQDRRLRGKVVQVEDPNFEIPEVGVRVKVEETGGSDVTNSIGVFVIPLPKGIENAGQRKEIKAGTRLRLIVDKPGWVIHNPLEGWIHVPEDPAELLRIRLLPRGSRLLWTNDRLEALIEELSDASARQARPQDGPQEVDFGPLLKEWATRYGFSVHEVREEIDRWATEVAQNENDIHRLGLVAFLRNNFGKAAQLFEQSGLAGERRLNRLDEQLEEIEEKRSSVIQGLVRDLRLAGNSHNKNLDFQEALGSYQRALEHSDNDSEATAESRAGLLNSIGTARWQLGIRVGGPLAREHLDQAIESYNNALQVYTRENLPQDWAMTLKDLGNALSDQGERKSGPEGLQLLSQAVSAHRNALQVYTREDLPLHWAMAQNDLGNALQRQGTRQDDLEGAQLLSEAVSAFRNALQVYTREDLPLNWAVVQNNLGIALRAQGRQTGGAEGMRLFSETVLAFRNALQVYTSEGLPQDWAMTQNNLGAALSTQGQWTGGAEGVRLLSEAVSAYRDALQVRTREGLPQGWAMTQNNLGSTLMEQAVRASGSEGEAKAGLLREAVQAFEEALEVRTRQHFRPQWAQTQENLAEAYFHLEEWQQAANAYASVAEVAPRYRSAYRSAVLLYENTLFDFEKAFQLAQLWRESHPDDFDAQVRRAGLHFLTERFDVGQVQLDSIRNNPELDDPQRASVLALDLFSSLLSSPGTKLQDQLPSLIEFIEGQTEDFEIPRRFQGFIHYAQQNSRLELHLPWLTRFFTALEADNRGQILADLREALALYTQQKQ